MSNGTCYIAGPMRGYEHFNFPAFDRAADLGRSLGFSVISPADMDRDPDGIVSADDHEATMNARAYAERDTRAILGCTHIAMLPGWEQSVGATAEYHLAKWIQLTVLDATTFEPLEAAPRQPTESILEEALRITRGDRQSDYGHPMVEHDRIARYWSIYTGNAVTAEDVAIMMVLLKVARQGHRNKRDSLVDIAGYADCCQRIVEAREQAREHCVIQRGAA